MVPGAYTPSVSTSRPSLQGGLALSNLRLMLPDRTPLRGADCTNISRARGLTRLELLGHASADAVEVVRTSVICGLPL